MARIADAPDLEVGPVGQIDDAVAMSFGELCYTHRLRRIDAARMRPDTNHESISGSHRLQGPRTPSPDRDVAHEASRSAAAIELRRVFQSKASCNRLKQISIAASASGFSRAMNARTSSLPSVASK